MCIRPCDDFPDPHLTAPEREGRNLLDSLSACDHSATLMKPEQARFGSFGVVMFFRQDLPKRKEGRTRIWESTHGRYVARSMNPYSFRSINGGEPAVGRRTGSYRRVIEAVNLQCVCSISVSHSGQKASGKKKKFTEKPATSMVSPPSLTTSGGSAGSSPCAPASYRSLAPFSRTSREVRARAVIFHSWRVDMSLREPEAEL